MDRDLTTARARIAPDARRRLRILLSAYACEPDTGWGSSIDWNWAVALAQAGHEVWVLTRAGNRLAVEKALEKHPLSGLHFAYYDLPGRARWWKHGGRAARLRYFLWQVGAYRVTRDLCRKIPFDVAHDIASGTFRQPSMLAFLDVPFVFGPVGGGETAPRKLRGTFPVRGYVGDLVRDAVNWAMRYDPLMAVVFRRSSAMLCRTREMLHRIPARYREKCMVQVDVGTAAQGSPGVRHRAPGQGGFRVLYVGRLVYWKGLHLGLMAFAIFRQARPDARLTVIGDGPDEAWLRRIAWLLGLEDAITWVPWLQRAAVMRAYPRHDALLFPSLHDSSGNAVLEALSRGLPVVCLDAGGPAILVDSSCGVKLRCTEPDEVVQRLADALCAFAEDPVRLRAMGEAAESRARQDFSWARQAGRMAGLYRTVCDRRASHCNPTQVTA